MNKNEYETIIKLLDEEKINELRKYLDERINIKDVNKVRKAIMSLINNHCEIDYPSYQARVERHEGPKKYYRGIYSEVDNGLVMLHRQSNAFQLYDRSILTPNIIKILEGTQFYNNKKTILSMSKSIIDFFGKLSTDELIPIQNAEGKEKVTTLLTETDIEFSVPSQYYEIAHQMLGEDIEEYAFEKGLFVDSPKGRALIMKNIE